MKGPSAASIALLACGALTSGFAGALGPVSLTLLALAAVLSAGRLRGWRSAVWGARRAPVTLAALIYLPLFAGDLALGALRDPVLPLARLVAFLATIELVAGERARPFRPLLLGVLFMVVAAAETTDAWFFPCLVAFAVAAAIVLAELTLVAALDGSGEDATVSPVVRTPKRVASALAVVTVALGGALFFVVPHEGSGWGTVRLGGSARLPRSTGLADEVDLGAIGRVKKIRAVALRARVKGGAEERLDPSSIYWRAYAFDTWTGHGWRRSSAADDQVPIRLWRGRDWSRESQSARPSHVFEIQLERPGLSELILPGAPVRISTTRRAAIAIDDEGMPVAYRGAGPRRYTVAVASQPGPIGDVLEPYLELKALDPRVAQWAGRIRAERLASGSEQMDAATTLALARAFERDLSVRAYSLDTGAIDPERPLASFLDGAAAHCEYFATAMTLGLRQRGVPARVVGGYLGADRLPLIGDLVVRERRAHLWVEAAVPGVGWVRFDPTPAAAQVPAGSFLAQASALVDWGVVAWDSWIIGIDLEDQQTLWLELRDRIAAAARWIVGVAVSHAGILLGLLVTTLFLWRFARRRRRVGGANGVELPRYVCRLATEARRHGVMWRAGMTARDLARRLSMSAGHCDEVSFVVGLYERERFGGRPATRIERHHAERIIAEIASERRASKVA